MSSGEIGKEYKKAFENRELSWIRFNERVLEEAANPANPLLERAKFAAIVTSNMDEFLQVRYHSVYEKREEKKGKKLYEAVTRRLREQSNRQYGTLERISEDLAAENIHFAPVAFRDDAMLRREDTIFRQDILPYLHVEPFSVSALRQKQLYLCVKLMRKKSNPFRLIPIPTGLPRVYDLNDGNALSCVERIEDIVRHNLQRLFPKEMVEYTAVFRILRNQDFPLTDDSPEGIVAATKDMLARRGSGEVMRMEAEGRISAELLSLLAHSYHLEPERIYLSPGPLDLNKLLMGLYSLIKRPDLKYTKETPLLLQELMGDDIFDKIEEKDRLLFHPYFSFDPVVHWMNRAAEDPSVRRISQTLYRVSGNSPVVGALIKAAENGKKVFVLMESRARFDEENNLYWGEKLERAGCEVLYGIPDYKVHSKITLIEREVDGSPRYSLHLGTGNYHDGTAKLYTDFGLLTADETLCRDAVAFFRQFEGEEYHGEELISAPEDLEPFLEEKIDRERDFAREGLPAHVLFKMNSINDPAMIEKLIEAANDGVRVDLLVRGICCVIPKIEGMTENLRVRSIVGRNLEHARVYAFENGGDHEIYLSSADCMGRNLYKRVELLFPVKDEDCRRAVENVLRLQWADTEKCRRRKKDGSYALKKAGERNDIDAQDVLVKNAAAVFDGTHPVLEDIPELFRLKTDYENVNEETELPLFL